MSLVFQGTNASALEKDIGPEQFPINEHYFGLVNVSITKSSHTITKAIAKENTGVIYPNTLSWVWVICWSVGAEVTVFVSCKNIGVFFQLISQRTLRNELHPPPLFFVLMLVHMWLHSLSLETHVTVTRCSKRSTSAGLSGRTCWPIKPSRRRRKTCSHAWLTSSTPSPRRRRKWASSRRRSSSLGYGKKTVRSPNLRRKRLQMTLSWKL